MSIGNIKSTVLRRILLVITLPVIAPIAVIGIAVEAGLRALPEVWHCFVEVWAKK